MKKKLFLVALVMGIAIAGLSAAPRYKMAVGGVFSMPFVGGLPNSAMLSFRLPNFPAVFAVGMYLPASGYGNGYFSAMADWWLYQGKLVNFVNIYVGPGLFLGIGDGFILGGRVPVGLNIYPIPPLELFLELAPGLTFIDRVGVQIPNFTMQAGVGFRFWF